MSIPRTIIVCFMLSACSLAHSSFFEKPEPEAAATMLAFQYLSYNETTHRAELTQLTGVDPVNTEWCAAFINAILHKRNLPGSESVSDSPLLAKSFLRWGKPVETPQVGDIVVFPRGNEGWQGHVGFYFGTTKIGAVTYYRILGGNQDNKVSIELYPADSAIAIRRLDRRFH